MPVIAMVGIHPVLRPDTLVEFRCHLFMPQTKVSRAEDIFHISLKALFK
jgi:hypothetical protein